MESIRRIQLASFLSNDHVHVLFQLCFKFNFDGISKKKEKKYCNHMHRKEIYLN